MDKKNNMRGSLWSALISTSRDFLLGVILLYGYIYTAYKYGNPFFGRNDFFHYQDMILHPFDLSVAPGPFVLRQIPAIAASLFYRLGIHFDTAATIDAVGFDDSTKRAFFAMILSNGVAVCVSFTVLTGYLRTKLATDSTINSLALFGIFTGWFYFPSAVIAPVTTGWGWLISSLFAVAFVERNAALTATACMIALFARETTIVFALVMFLALLLAGRERSRGVLGSIFVLAVSCLIYPTLRIFFTSGYAYQFDPHHIIVQLTSFSFPEHFFVQSILAQGMLVLLLALIALRRVRYAAYLLIAAVVISVLALVMAASDVGMVLGETLPFYAAIFMLAWGHALPERSKEQFSALAGGTQSGQR